MFYNLQILSIAIAIVEILSAKKREKTNNL